MIEFDSEGKPQWDFTGKNLLRGTYKIHFTDTFNYSHFHHRTRLVSVYVCIIVHNFFVTSQARPMDHPTLTEASEPHTEQEATYLWTLHHTSSLEETRSSSQVRSHGYFYPLDTVMATPFF
jgi:hypothetical protein